MNSRLSSRSRRRGERGIYLVIAGIALPALLVFVGLGLDVGHNLDTQRSLAGAGDASSIAGATSLDTAPQATIPYPGGIPAVCTDFERPALQAAALNGVRTLVASNDSVALSCSNAPDTASYCYGSYSQPSGGTPGVPDSTNVPTASTYDVIFFDAAGHGAPNACSSPDTWTTQVEIVMPVRLADLPGTGGECAASPDNCVEVIVSKRVNNAIMSIAGQPQTVVRYVSRAYGKPGNTPNLVTLR